MLGWYSEGRFVPQNDGVSSSSAVPVGQPLYGASFVEAIKRFFKGYVIFSGRASRSEFWWAMLFSFLVSLVIQIPFWILWSIVLARTAWTQGGIADAAGQDVAALSGVMILLMAAVILFSLAMILPTYAVMWRRLQDGSFHGAFSLLSLVGLGLVPLIMCALPSQPAGAQYDPAYRAQLSASGYDPIYAPQQGYQPPIAYGEPSLYGQPGPYGQPDQVVQQYPQAGPYDQSAPYGRPGPYDQQPYSGGYAQQSGSSGQASEQQPQP